MNPSNNLYREEANFLLRENMHKLKGLVDLLCLGILDTLNEKEKEEFLQKIRSNMTSLFTQLEFGINPEQGLSADADESKPSNPV